jgi:hypothetical protein
MFDCEKLLAVGLDPATLYPNVLPRPPPLPVGNKRIRRMPKSTSAADVFKEAAEEVDNGTQGLEEQEELNDAMSPIYDQLSLAKSWWVLEILPMKRRYQRVVDDSWASTWKYVYLSALFTMLCRLTEFECA